MAPNRVTSPASAKDHDMPDHAEVPSSRSRFEVGKTYRMMGGGTATIIKNKNRLLIGYTSPLVPYVRCWDLNGEYSSAAREFTLTGRAI